MTQEGNSHGWTFDSLIKHYDEKLNDFDDRLDERWNAQEQAVRDALLVLNARLNGFPQLYSTKAELESMKTTFDNLRLDHVTRTEHDLVKESIQTIRSDHVTREEFNVVRGSLSKVMGAVALLAFSVPIVVHFIK